MLCKFFYWIKFIDHYSSLPLLPLPNTFQVLKKKQKPSNQEAQVMNHFKQLSFPDEYQFSFLLLNYSRCKSFQNGDFISS
jgi:hypothetical protein